MNELLLQQFVRLISTNTGLHIREQDKPVLRQKILTRMKLLKFSVPEQYYQLLATETEPSVYEWKDLVLLLTVGESYFFRDREQFILLQTQILPELIERKKKVKLLRIWSAGCSTGQEAYSLAILVYELLPDFHEWNLLILGTDINQEAIEKAKRGIYNSWSFRFANSDIQTRYFNQQKTKWEVNEKIRRMVKFYCVNLVKDNFPNYTYNIYDIDLILCRNVFIYFDFNAVSVVLEKFYNSLSPGGYLITGHGELYGQNLGQLQARFFSQSILYQRNANLPIKTSLAARNISHKTSTVSGTNTSLAKTAEATTNKTATTSTTTPPTQENLQETEVNKIFREAKTLFQNQAYSEAIYKAEQVLRLHPLHFNACHLIAHSYANIGNYNRAVQYCMQALNIDPMSVPSHYLLARIAETQGDIEKAKTHLKKIIYLAPASIYAFLELGSIYSKAFEFDKARKMYYAAFEMLNKLQPNDVVEHYEQMTASELIVIVKNKLNDT